MNIFGRKKDKQSLLFYSKEEEDYEERRSYRKIRDLKSENKRSLAGFAGKRYRKEPPKPWSKKERYIVLSVLLTTIFISGILAISARDFKLPGFPRLSINFKKPSFNLFKEETITIGGKLSDTNGERRKEITKKFEEKTKNLSGIYTLYVIDLSNNYSFGINEDEVMQAASLIKLPVMLYSIGKVDEGKIEAMGKRSDNAVFRELVNKFGNRTLQNYIFELGMKKTSIEENETTPKEIGDLFKKIYNDKNEIFLDYLTDTIYEEWLPAGVPNDIRVAHKYGREIHVVNDAGVVFSSKPYIVVIMTQGIVEKEADEIFPELSRVVYEGMLK